MKASNNNNLSDTALTMFFLTVTLLILIFSCNPDRVIKHGPEPDPVPDKNIIYAGHFDLRKTDSCTILTINDPWQGAGNIIHE